MSAKRVDLEVMTCVHCGVTKAWTDGFPVRMSAVCWTCSWERHVENAHPIQSWQAQRRAKRRARRSAIWVEREKATAQLRQDIITKADT